MKGVRIDQFNKSTEHNMTEIILLPFTKVSKIYSWMQYKR